MIQPDNEEQSEATVPMGEGREERINQPKPAIATNRSPSASLTSSSSPLRQRHLAPRPRCSGARRCSPRCVVNATFRHATLSQKDAAVGYFFRVPSDAGGTGSEPSQCPCAEKRFDTTAGRFTVPLPLVLALTDGAVSDSRQAPASSCIS